MYTAKMDGAQCEARNIQLIYNTAHLTNTDVEGFEVVLLR
jgi:hypothetical protein